MFKITAENQLESHEQGSTENGENKGETTTTEDNDIVDTSPRGVLERSASSSEIDRFTSLSSSIINHKLTEDDESLSSALSMPSRGNHNNNNINIHSVVQLKSKLDNMRKNSVRRLSSVAFINNIGQSRKGLRWKHGRSHASEDSIEWMMPKPSWRNFTLQELEAATKKFSPGVSPFFLISFMEITTLKEYDERKRNMMKFKLFKVHLGLIRIHSPLHCTHSTACLFLFDTLHESYTMNIYSISVSTFHSSSLDHLILMLILLQLCYSDQITLCLNLLTISIFAAFC